MFFKKQEVVLLLLTLSVVVRGSSPPNDCVMLSAVPLTPVVISQPDGALRRAPFSPVVDSQLTGGDATHTMAAWLGRTR
ncbi:hypothetical protein YC2023_090006 [Brassica napus]